MKLESGRSYVMVEEERKKRVVQSLGWLTESSIKPKKHRAIEGIGASTILELKAQLYKSQEESKKSKELNAPSRDKLELKAVNDGSVSYAALEKKAEFYDKLARGELSDEEDKEKYCVDFFRKGVEHEESQKLLQIVHASENS